MTLFKRLLPVLIIVALTLLFFYKLAFTELILARGDTYVYFYPYWDARDAALGNGELPLWTNDLFMGAPLLANPQLGTFYPPNWLTIPLNAPDSVRVSILMHIAWAFLGAYLLARRVVNIDMMPAIVAGTIFALGGYIGAHVEQINQLQGLAWLPWLFLCFDRAQHHPHVYVPLLGICWAMQILSGHTQTVFIAGVGLGVYMVVHPLRKTLGRGTRGGDILRSFMYLALATGIAVIIALPQLLPTQELISLSNRGDGLNPQEATAFSLHPFLIGRGLLPSYDAQPFSEYIGYIGVVGIGLAVIGALHSDKRRWVWVILVAIGLVFALGRNTPVYLTLASLPGFNLFRVPARWLALAALGAAMLAGLGVQAIIHNTLQRHLRVIMVTVGIVVLLMGLSLLADRAAAEVDGAAVPTALTFAGWSAALILFIAVVLLQARWKRIQKYGGFLLCLFVVGELWLAANFLPYNDVTDPAVYTDSRFAINQLRVFAEDGTPPGRLMTMSGLLFDPGDKATLENRWATLPITDRAARYAFTATKIQETLSGNLPLTWGVPSIDGFGGGVLPTAYYTAFTSLLLPEGTLRSVDGRLREVLAQPNCRGACIPEDRWLDLMHVRYLLTDKVYDLVHEGIFYDTQLTVDLSPGESVILQNPLNFQSTAAHLLITCGDTPPCIEQVTFDDAALSPRIEAEPIVLDGLTFMQFFTEEATSPEQITITAAQELTLYAITLVDTRTDDFVQLTPSGWQRVYSADIKIYENMDVLPRAFVVHEVVTHPDTWQGTEDALVTMRQPDFEPSQTVVINTNEPIPTEPTQVNEPASVEITSHTATEAVIQVDSPAPGYLVLTDAYYPGWEATVYVADEDEAIFEGVYRANVMFRAVPIPQGESRVVFTYRWPFSRLP